MFQCDAGMTSLRRPIVLYYLINLFCIGWHKWGVGEPNRDDHAQTETISDLSEPNRPHPTPPPRPTIAPPPIYSGVA